MLGTGATVVAALGVVLVGVVLQRRLRGTKPLVRLPGQLGIVVAAVAVTVPFVLFVWTGALSAPVDDSLAALVVALAAWLLSSLLFGVGRPGSD